MRLTCGGLAWLVMAIFTHPASACSTCSVGASQAAILKHLGDDLSYDQAMMRYHSRPEVALTKPADGSSDDESGGDDNRELAIDKKKASNVRAWMDRCSADSYTVVERHLHGRLLWTKQQSMEPSGRVVCIVRIRLG